MFFLMFCSILFELAGMEEEEEEEEEVPVTEDVFNPNCMYFRHLAGFFSAGRDKLKITLCRLSLVIRGEPCVGCARASCLTSGCFFHVNNWLLVESSSCYICSLSF